MPRQGPTPRTVEIPSAEAVAKERWEHLNKLCEMYKDYSSNISDSALMKTARPR